MSNRASQGLHIDQQYTTVKIIGGNDCDGGVAVDLEVMGGARIRKNLCVDQDIVAHDVTVEGNLYVFENITAGETVTARDIVGGTVTAGCFIGNVCCDLVVQGNLLVGDLVVSGSLSVSDLVVQGNLLVGDLVVSGNIVAGCLEVVGPLNVYGNVSAGPLTILGGETVQGDLIVQGNTNVTIDPVALANALQNAPITLVPTLLDAFGAQRVSNPYTLLDSKFLTGPNLAAWDQLVQGTASVVFQPSYLTLTAPSIGDRAVRQSRLYCPYQPGKGLRIMCTGTLETTAAANVTARIGFFDDSNDKDPMLDTEASGNGYFFEWDGSTVNVVERSFITGAQVDTKVPQNMWNVDRFDGTGPSGIVLDITKRQIFFFELEWLGVGTVVTGFMINRKLYWAHAFQHANLSGPLPYISRPTLPVRYELSSQGGSGVMQQVCATVISDGGYQPKGSIFSRSMGASTDVSISGGHVALMALRLKTAQKRTLLTLLRTTVLAVSGNDFYLALYRFVAPAVDPFSGTATWLSAGTYSGAEYAVQDTMLSMTFSNAGGIILDETYVSNRADFGGSDLADRFGAIVTSNISGASDILVVAAGPDAGVKAAVAMQWQEFE